MTASGEMKSCQSRTEMAFWESILIRGLSLLITLARQMATPISPQIQLEKTYNAAADHYDHPAVSFWDRFGRRTIQRLPITPDMNLLDVCCPVYEQWASLYGLAYGGAGRRESSTEAFDSSKDCRPLDWLRSHVESEARRSSELLIQAREIRFVDFRVCAKLGFRVVEVQVKE